MSYKEVSNKRKNDSIFKKSVPSSQGHDNKSFVTMMGQATNDEYSSDDTRSVESDDEGREKYKVNEPIEPLKIKMTRSPFKSSSRKDNENIWRESETFDSSELDKIDDKLGIVRANLQKLHNQPDLDYWLTSVDLESFQAYLKNPQYMKLFQKKPGSNRLKRLFLAQELKVNVDEDELVSKMNSSSSSKAKKYNGLKLKSLSKAIWSIKFSLDGKHMASGCKDGSINIWKTLGSPVDRWAFENKDEKMKVEGFKKSNNPDNVIGDSESVTGDLYGPVFQPKPIMQFDEHNNDILDMDWSKNGFLVSASMDKSVKLWNVEKKQALRTYIHPDFVTSVQFLPTDDRFIITGCLDHKCRVWSILDNSICFEFDGKDLITAMIVSPGDGKYTFIGTFNGYIHVLETNQLNHITTFHVTDKHTQGVYSCKALMDTMKDRKSFGPKVTSLQSYLNACDGALRLAVSSNDSKIRIFDLKTRKMVEYVKGFRGDSSQHKVNVSMLYDRQYVFSGSDDHWVFGWQLKSSDISLKRNKNDKISTGNSIKRSGSLKQLFRHSISSSSGFDQKRPSSDLDDLYHTDYKSNNKRFSSILPIPNAFKDKAIRNTSYISFHAHHSPVTTVTMAPLETSKQLSLSNDLISELTLEYFNENNLDTVVTADSITHNSSASSRKSISMNTSSSKKDVVSTSALGGAVYNNPLPNLVKAIGTIFISADTSGTIRVFRVDLPTEIRKFVLKKIKSNIDIIENDIDSSTTYTNNRSAETENIDGSYKNNIIHSTSAVDINKLQNIQGNESVNSRTPRVSRVFMNSLFNRSDSNLSSLKCRSTVNGSTKNNHRQPNFTDRPRNSVTLSDIDRYSNPTRPKNISNRFRCDVCNGTKIEQVSTTESSLSGQHISRYYYCTECGTQLNNLR